MTDIAPALNDRELPHGDTYSRLRERILRHAAADETHFNRLIAGMATPRAAESIVAHHASLYGYATASLLGFIANRFGPDAAFKAAAMVEDMGVNGGAPYCDDEE